MTTFDTIENSVESASPIELYDFVAGDTSYYLTSGAEPVTYTHNYTPAQIGREITRCRQHGKQTKEGNSHARGGKRIGRHLIGP